MQRISGADGHLLREPRISHAVDPRVQEPHRRFALPKAFVIDERDHSRKDWRRRTESFCRQFEQAQGVGRL